MNPSTLIRIVLVASLLACANLHAEERGAAPLADVLNIDATVSSDVAPDLAVVRVAVEREGPDVAPLTRDVNETLTRAFAEARSVPGVIAANGGYNTAPRFELRNGQSVRTGWQVRAEIVLKSRDFNALGALVGRLAQTMQIAGSGFEISPELRASESAALIERGARAFQDKAQAASKAFGYTGYGIRQVTVGSVNPSGSPRMMAMDIGLRGKSATPMPVESGLVTLTLTVEGSLQLRK